MIKKFASFFSVLLVTTHVSLAFAKEKDWQSHVLSEHGIAIALPVPPKKESSRSPDGDGQLIMYRGLDQANMRQYSIFISQPEQRGIFDPESMDAFLDSHLKSLIDSSTNGKILSSKRTQILGKPAIEYSYKHSIEGISLIAKGITFMVDGGHIRLSMWCRLDDSNCSELYNKFINSFKLTPIAYSSASSLLSDKRGVSFKPPMGWVKKNSRNSYEIARFSNLTRSIALLASGNRSYNCDAYKGELQRAGIVIEESQQSLNGKKMQKIITSENVPKYNVRLTTAHYCQNSSIGAVVLTGTEEESTYWRWAAVIEGSAATVKVPSL